ncbi:hypothetical protein [Shewanella waksmanii]|uniref:hypothetical protein n=1 Tax=Shewanella waksmanii TaxID=213783 RepID=UPI0004BB0CB0|nr:hypothetical protein [Shewanella waksmanii]
MTNLKNMIFIKKVISLPLVIVLLTALMLFLLESQGQNDADYSKPHISSHPHNKSQLEKTDMSEQPKNDISPPQTIKTQSKETVTSDKSDPTDFNIGVALGENIFSLTKKGEWNELISLANSMKEISPQIMQVMVLQAIRQDAPLFVIIELLNQGATLPDNTIFILVIKGQIEKIIELQNYGLNMFYSSESLGNAVNVAVKYKAKIPILTLLLENDVDTNIKVNGQDPLNTAINEYFRKGHNIETISKLIEYHAAIDSSHFNTVESNRLKNNKYYSELALEIPSLTIKLL